ncbi:MAG TPA: GGDEF domain-containing protein, partial [Solirubrobacteraceae bacterium]|nr:GGDEF domain-containing protein [Solirubrobacteraceae bacterium]
MSPARPRSPLPVRGILAVLALWGVASVLGRVLTDRGDLLRAPFEANVSVAMGGVGALLVLARAVQRKGPSSLGWAVVAGALLLWTAGDVLTLSDGAVGVVAAPAFRLLYVLAALALGAGLLAVVHARHPPADRAVRLDALTTGLAAASLVTWLGVDPVRDAIGPDAPLFTAATHVVLISLDALLLVIAVTGCALLRWRPDRTWALATVAAGSFVLAEIGYALGAANGTWSPASPTNAGWSSAMILLAFAAWSPQRRAADRPVHGELRDVVLPFVFSLASIVLLAAAEPLEVGTAPRVLAAASLCAALVRLLLTALEHGAMLRTSQAEARTDPLTGLGNRRRLSDDLATALADPSEDAALVLFDLDGFKGYNDRHGHPAGDALLIALGGALAAEVGAARAYRLGGDELCALIVAPRSVIDAAVDAAAGALARAAEHAGIG